MAGIPFFVNTSFKILAVNYKYDWYVTYLSLRINEPRYVESDIIVALKYVSAKCESNSVIMFYIDNIYVSRFSFNIIQW